MLILKKDLPTAKAGTEIKKHPVVKDCYSYFAASFDSNVFIPPEVFDEWVEDTEKKWTPAFDETYYYPHFENTDHCAWHLWRGDITDTYLLNSGVICRTEKQAIALAKKMLEAVGKK